MDRISTAIRSLIIGNYSSVYGSLRWIIESMMFWTDIHSEKENFIELFEFFAGLARLSKNQFSKLLLITSLSTSLNQCCPCVIVNWIKRGIILVGIITFDFRHWFIILYHYYAAKIRRILQ